MKAYVTEVTRRPECFLNKRMQTPCLRRKAKLETDAKEAALINQSPTPVTRRQTRFLSTEQAPFPAAPGSHGQPWSKAEKCGFSCKSSWWANICRQLQKGTIASVFMEQEVPPFLAPWAGQSKLPSHFSLAASKMSSASLASERNAGSLYITQQRTGFPERIKFYYLPLYACF